MADFAIMPKADLEMIRKLAANMCALDFISEEEAAKLLGNTIKTIQNKVSSGQIPPSCYRMAVDGTSRVYSRTALVGL